MWSKFRFIVSSPELRNKFIFIIGALVAFRVLAAVPVPGVDLERLKSFLEGNQFFGLLNIFSGGALDNLSIVMMGVSPYITASIIMQLLTMIFPAIKEMYQEEGEAGRQRFNQYARLLTVPLAILQSYGLLTLLMRQEVIRALSPFEIFTNLAVITAGTLILMWIGELISEKGIGNGISLLIFAGIVSRFPSDFQQFIATFDPALLPSYLVFLLIALFVIASVIVVSEGQRNIPVSYAKRVRGMRVYGGVSTHLPLRVNQAGVIPIIFAVSIVLFPGLVGNLLAGVETAWAAAISKFLIAAFTNAWIYGIVYFLLVFLFTYVYTSLTFDPHAISENVQKQGGFILGIRPGRPTAEFLQRVLSRITLAGALFLGTIAILPLVAQGIFNVQAFTLGGTALLIVVSVILETMKQIDAQIVMREYE